MSTSEVNASYLRAFIERIEQLEEEKKAIEEEKKELSDDIKHLSHEIVDVYAEAKANGFDVKIMRKIVALPRREGERRSEAKILRLYVTTLGES